MNKKTLTLLKTSLPSVVLLLSDGALAAGRPDLAVGMQANPNPVTVNSLVTYVVTVKNLGPGKARQVKVIDQLPSNASFQSASAGCKFQNKRARAKLQLTCKAKLLQPGQQAQWSIILTATQLGTIGNSATATSLGRDANRGNNSFGQSVTVNDGSTQPVSPTNPDPNNPNPTNPIVTCPTLVPAAFSGGCTLYLVSPDNCKLLDKASNTPVEFAWTTNGTFCEGPHTIYFGGNPPSTWEWNSFSYSISSGQWDDRAMTRNIGGFILIKPSEFASLQTDNGMIHWGVRGWYGSSSESRTFLIK